MARGRLRKRILPDLELFSSFKIPKSRKMKTTINLLLSVLILGTILSTFSSCGGEEKKVTEISFDVSTQTVAEDESEIFIPYEIKNGPTDDDASITFSFSGTATEDEDFIFTGWSDDGVTLELINDNAFESDETIVVSMTSGEKVSIGQPDTHTVTIEDNDVDTGTNLKIDLTWDAGSGTPGDVDMDLILWSYDPINEVFNLKDASAVFGTAFESLTLSAAEADATYGVTYQYYSGTSNTLEFTVTFITTDGSINGTENELSFSETYTLDNVNPSVDVYIEQIFNKVGTDYNNFSVIDVPPTGSRLKSFKIPSLKSHQNTISKKITARKTGK
jgi:hypothetical protein